MSNYQIKIPSVLYGGEGSIENLREIMEKEQAKRILVFTDQGVLAAGLTEPITELIRSTGREYLVYANLIPEPAWQDVAAMMAETAAYLSDLVIAVGGGSVMDAAKLYTVLAGADYTIEDLLSTPEKAVKKVKSVMIPTTCGTGAEATCNAIVAIPEQHTKQGIVNGTMIPDYVILDSTMIKKLPPSIIAATGVDALAHAVECFTSNKATPFSDTYALASAQLIFRNIRTAYREPDQLQAKGDMLLGAFYGGIAITGSGTTAVHALAYPLGGRYHIAHGVSNAILLAHVMEFNKDACLDRLALLCDGVYPQYAAKTAAEKAALMIADIKAIVKETEIPVDLSSFGVKITDLDVLVQSASKQQRLLANNRKELSHSDIRRIYLKVLKEEA